MRLLTHNKTGLFSLTEYPPGSDIPPYAILSHTWGPEEVTYKDLEQGTGQHKIGYEKIRFCGQQAGKDGLQYFWVDTCCIDKSSSAELTEAINSMFRWYGDAAKCYAYLQDNSRHDTQDWKLQFEQSRWFTRGWTLQELIAPRTVDFYSREGTLLGDKESLERLVCNITDIPARALQGESLSLFTTSERMAWAETRKTTVPEDKAYSLLGIFEIHMPMLYGEGEERALKRLREEIAKDQKGSHYEDYSIMFSLHGIPEIERFVAREQELAEMSGALKGDGRRVVVVHGLGGMGKTQLAIEYTKRYRDNYSAILWINAKDENSLKRSFDRIAHQIKQQHASAGQANSLDKQKDLINQDLSGTINVVKTWLNLPNNTRWLLVYDNYDNPKLLSGTDPTAINIQEYLPESYQGSVVITTRSSQVKIGHTIRIAKIQNLDDSLEILTITSKRQNLAEDPDAISLARKLDGLPLALATAGAYLEQMSTTFQSYLRLYEDSWSKLQINSPSLHSYEDRTLYSTWQLSYNQVQRQNKNSAALLQLWAYFDNQDIWLELLQSHSTHNIDWIHEVTQDEISFALTVRTLSDYGFVEASTSVAESMESKGYSVHSCVHSWTASVLNQERSIELARFAVSCTASHLATIPEKWWLKRRRLLPHSARYSVAMILAITDHNDAWIFNSLALLYLENGQLDKGEHMFWNALQSSKLTYGPDDVQTLDSAHRLGAIYRKQGKLKNAEEMYRQALEGYEKTFGPNHPRALRAINSLGIVYDAQGQLEEAEEMYQRAIQICEEVPGSNDPMALDILSNIAILYFHQGRFRKAEETYERVLEGYENALGPDHPKTLKVYNNLGALYERQGQNERSEKVVQWTLQGYEKGLGPDHILTLTSAHILGIVYAKTGQIEKAEKMYRRALQGYEKSFVPDHPDILSLVGGLGHLYRSQGQLRMAEEMFQRSLKGYEKVFGLNNATTLRMVLNLGIVYRDQCQLDKAEKMLQQALHGFETIAGLNHQDTQIARYNLRKLNDLIDQLIIDQLEADQGAV